jgi:hypothetical protein
MVVQWQRGRARVRTVSWWLRTGLFVLFWIAFGLPIYQKSLGHGIAYTLFAVAVMSARAYRWSTPKNMQMVEREYLLRKTTLYRLLKQIIRRGPHSEAELKAFQVDALSLVASYVRGHRGAPVGAEIFVNLLVPVGDELVVVARDSDHRIPGARYPKEGMLAWEAVRSGEMCFAGDVQGELPNCAEKPYRSILVIPVMGEDRVLGAVSIDSTRRYHFDLEAGDLERFLQPYVVLLGWTLERNGTTVPVVSASP